MSKYLEKYYKISQDDTIIAQGKVILDKEIIGDKFLDNPLISFDNKLFFSTCNSRYKIEEISKCDTKINIKLFKNLIVRPFKKPEFEEFEDYFKDFYVYRDYDYTELDEECKDLCDVLNNFDGVSTISSCCGHDYEPLWIDIRIKSFKFLLMLYHYCLQNRNSFLLRSSCFTAFCRKDEVIFSLRSYEIGKKAYLEAEKLAVYLKNIYEIKGD